MTVSPIPQGYQSLCPYMMVPDAAKVVAFLKLLFDAQVVNQSLSPTGQLLNAELNVRGSMMMLSDCRDFPARLGTIYMYVEDCDGFYNRALEAGATPIMPPADMFYGDRHGGVTDVCGNQWWFATRIENVSPEEVTKRAAAFYAKK